MLPRVLASLLGVLGAAAMGLGVASATVWRPSDTLTATASVDGYVVTDPGVLDLAADEVTVTATGVGPVVIALGRTSDVEAWLGQDPAWHVTGLTTRTELTTLNRVPEATPSATPSTEPSAEASASGDASASTSASPTASASASPSASASASADPSGSPSPAATGEPGDGTTGDGAPASALADPSGSDLWVEEVTGSGSATLQWEHVEGRWSLLIAAPQDGTVQVQMVWPQVVRTPWLRPGLAVGGVLLAIGVLWWTLLLVRARRPWVGMGLAGWLGHWRDLLVPAGPVPPRSPEVESLGRHAVTGEQPLVAAEPIVAPSGSDPAAPGGGVEPAAEPAPQTVPAGPLTRRALRELREREERERAEALEAERLARRGSASPGADAVTDTGSHVPIEIDREDVAPEPTGRGRHRTGALPVVDATDGTATEPADADATGTDAAEADGHPAPDGRPSWMSWRPDGWRVRGSVQPGAPSAVPESSDPPLTWPSALRTQGGVAADPAARPPRSQDETSTPAADAPQDEPPATSPAPRRLFGLRRGRPAPAPVASERPAPEPDATAVPVPEPPSSGPSADAWRRAWGLPATEEPAGARTAGAPTHPDAPTAEEDR